MILNITGVAPIGYLSINELLEFCKYFLEGLIEYIYKGIQPTSVSHPESDIFDSMLR